MLGIGSHIFPYEWDFPVGETPLHQTDGIPRWKHTLVFFFQVLHFPDTFVARTVNQLALGSAHSEIQLVLHHIDQTGCRLVPCFVFLQTISSRFRLN